MENNKLNLKNLLLIFKNLETKYGQINQSLISSSEISKKFVSFFNQKYLTGEVTKKSLSVEQEKLINSLKENEEQAKMYFFEIVDEIQKFDSMLNSLSLASQDVDKDTAEKINKGFENLITAELNKAYGLLGRVVATNSLLSKEVKNGSKNYSFDSLTSKIDDELDFLSEKISKIEKLIENSNQKSQEETPNGSEEKADKKLGDDLNSLFGNNENEKERKSSFNINQKS